MADSSIARTNEDIEDAVAHDPSEQYLTFYIEDEIYGVDILSVQEIRGWEPATEIPNAPDYIKGVINLRGTVVPITDLRCRFGIKQFEYSGVTVVIVIKVQSGKSEKTMGIVVDAVSDVSNFKRSDIHPAPELSENTNTAFVKGLGSAENKMVILLDINKLMNTSDEEDLSTISRAIPA
jgi:purine-binding chemotaxis protein CheW